MAKASRKPKHGHNGSLFQNYYFPSTPHRITMWVAFLA
jgi:hypothetical protein